MTEEDFQKMQEAQQRSRSAQQRSSYAQQARSAAAASGIAEAARLAAEENAKKQEELENSKLRYEDYFNQRLRTAWILTTMRRRYNYHYDAREGRETRENETSYGIDHDWSDKNSPLIFNVNPNSYQMDNPFRQQIVEAKGGPVIHTFRDPNRGYTNFGFATMNIEMSSGSLMPWAMFKGKQGVTGQKFTMPPSIGNFYRFLEIVQEDTVYENGGVVMPNYQIIKMSTLLFPRLTLYGFFVQNANWSEQAEQPTEIQNWQVQFKIYKTTPELTINNIQNLYSHWDEEYHKQYVQQGSRDTYNT